jgi:hypothetical protein
MGSTRALSFVKPSRWRAWRWPRRIAYGLLAALLSVVVWQTIRHYQIAANLQTAVDVLNRDDPGWRLADIEAAREVIPDDENSAQCAVRVASMVPENWLRPEFAQAFARLDPPVRLTQVQYTQLAAELEDRGAACREARKLANLPKGRHTIRYARLTTGTLMPDQPKSRFAAALLRYDVLRLAEEDRPDEALQSCRGIINAGRSLGDEPTLISMLIRTACVAIGCNSAERVLAQAQPDPREMLALQRLLEDEDAFPSLTVGIRGERAMGQESFDAMESGEVSLAELSGEKNGPDWNERLFGREALERFRVEHPIYLETMSRAIEISRMPPHQQPAAEEELEAKIAAIPRTAPLTRLLLPAIQKCGQANRRKLAVMRTTIAALAAERYRRAHGDWPNKLSDLVGDSLDAVLLDPYDGEPLRCRRRIDGLTIYSIGPDGVDDGGVIDDENRFRTGSDIGIRLWDPDNRRQPPAS